MRMINQIALNAVASAASTPSNPLLAEDIFNITCVATFSDGTAAGTLSLQGSNDPKGNNLAPNVVPATWVTIPGATATVAAGATTLLVPTNAVCYQWIRVLWAKSGGAGTITASIAAQGA